MTYPHAALSANPTTSSYDDHLVVLYEGISGADEPSERGTAMLRSADNSVNVNEVAAQCPKRSSGKTSPSRPQNGALYTPIVPGQGPQVATHDESSFESNMRARLTIALEDHLDDCPDMANFLQTKLTINGSTSPKPCIVPGNALQLIDDDPTSASRSHTPSSVIIIDEDGNEHHDPSTESCPDPENSREQEQERRPVPRVRFRSRVRITSGLRRSRHAANPTSTPSSSASGSPSSSISAPLRWQADESSPWGPIGNRLNAYARANGWRRSTSLRTKQERERLLQQISGERELFADVPANERTPLNAGRKSRISYVDAGLDGGMDADDEGTRLLEDEIDEAGQAMRAAALEREKEAMFGPWPWRIFNRHWWWYHTEPIFCCCADDSEYDDDPC